MFLSANKFLDFVFWRETANRNIYVFLEDS